MLTGECEGLNHSWLFNQTVQNGYAYTKKVSVKESQSPPLEDGKIGLTKPGVLREGATVAVELEDTQDLFEFEIQFFDWEHHYMIIVSVSRERIWNMPGVTKFTFEKTFLVDYVVCTSPQITKGMKSKISFRAHTGRLELLVDDHKICMVNTTVDLTTLRMMSAYVHNGILHGVEFIDA